MKEKEGIVLIEKEKGIVMLGIERLQVESKKLATKAEAMSNKSVLDEIKKHYEMLEDLKTRFL